MIREVHGFGHEESELRTHLVGLEPRHSANAPDAWETDALKRLAQGEPEVSSERTIRGATFLQTMRPLIVEESCLKCHAERGYRVGELRGGISISVPFAPLWPLEKAEMLRSIAGYGSMWLFGLCSILFGARQLRRQIEQRIETEKALREREGQMIAAQHIQEHLFPERPPAPRRLRHRRGGVSGRVYQRRLLRLHPLARDVLRDRCRRCLRARAWPRIAHGVGTVHSAIRRADDRRCQRDIDPRLTAFCGRTRNRITLSRCFSDDWTLSSRQFSYASAGHPTAYVLDASGKVKARLESTAPPLGIMPDAAFPAGESLTLEPGDLAILLTDGVLEATAPDGTPFGESRVLEVVRGSQSQPAGQIISRLHRAVLDFRRQEVLLDDMTAIVLKVDARP